MDKEKQPYDHDDKRVENDQRDVDEVVINITSPPVCQCPCHSSYYSQLQTVETCLTCTSQQSQSASSLTQMQDYGTGLCVHNKAVDSFAIFTEGTEKQQEGNLIHCLVGQGKQLMIGRDRLLAAISPVFQSMLSGRWRKNLDIAITIPDVETQAFGVLLRHSEGDSDLDITDSTVWDVLKAADEYSVVTVVERCFHFLLHVHGQRHSSRHLCAVLEKAHGLNYDRQRRQCMAAVKRRARRVLSSKEALGELCFTCMLEMVRADDLRGVPEMAVSDGVTTWARQACKRRGVTNPGWEDLRAEAGQLVYHVRYLTLPRHSLRLLSLGLSSSCLLTKQELGDLLQGKADPAVFPTQVRRQRRRPNTFCAKLKQNMATIYCLVLAIAFMSLLTFGIYASLYNLKGKEDQD